MTAGFNIAMSDDQIASLTTLCAEAPDAAEIVFGGFHAERRQKPTIRDGKWCIASVIVTLDREGRVLAETFEEIAP